MTDDEKREYIRAEIEQAVMTDEQGMSEDTAWWRWPEDRLAGRVPWFVVLRHALVMPVLLPAFALCFFAIACGWGISDARRWWRDSF